MTEDEMVGWHHRLNGHEFEQTLGDGERQGSLACCSPWGCRESDTNEQLNNGTTTTGFVSPRHGGSSQTRGRTLGPLRWQADS